MPYPRFSFFVRCIYNKKVQRDPLHLLFVIYASAAVAPFDINYSRFMYGLKKSGIEMNRKALSELAISDPEAFAVLVDTAKKAL